MNNFYIFICIFSVTAAVLFAFYNYVKTKRTMDTLEKMIDDAIKGDFHQKNFDETKLSFMENKLASYLSSAQIIAKNVAEEKDKIKSLIADISHQTKTPISNLLLYSELLTEENLPDTAKDVAQILYAQSQKLHFLIDALIKLSRLENGIIKLNPEKQHIYPMLRNLVNQYRYKAENKGLAINLKNLDTEAIFDLKWTGEAVGNIIDNAVKYTYKGGIDICVSSYEMFARIDIKDSGIGIAQEDYTKVFARFGRLESSKQQEGVGLGLYLAREIISSQGGYIKLNSKQGQGCTFSVFLPK